MRAGVAAIIAVLAVLAAVGVGLASSRLFAPSPTPVRVNVTVTPTPSPIPTPYDEAALFRGQPLSGGCATTSGVWVVTNGGGLLRLGPTGWVQVDGTLRSLVRAACSSDRAYGIGFLGALLVGDEQTHQIYSSDIIQTEDLFGISIIPEGAVIVGSRGSVFLVETNGYPTQGPPVTVDDLFGVVAFNLQSAWVVGDHGLAYRLDQRGWTALASGQGNALRAIAGTTPVNVVAVGDAGTVVTYANGAWRSANSGVDVALRDVIVAPGLWIAGDGGTLLTTSGVPSTPFRRVDIGTTCDLVSLFAAGGDIWVVGRGASGGGVWRLRPDGTVAQHFGGC
jgi:hypothetical protein